MSYKKRNPIARVLNKFNIPKKIPDKRRKKEEKRAKKELKDES